MNKDDFHIPFVKSLMIVVVVTIFAMVSSHYIVNYYADHYSNTPVFTSHQSDIATQIAK